jgi:Protein of unknwon function (DUF3310)
MTESKFPISNAAQMELFPKSALANGMNGTTADSLQIGGQHYKDMSMQPWAVMEAVLTHEEFVGFLKGNVIKYGMRQGKKDSDDSNKAKHYALKLAEIQNAQTKRS